MRRIIVAPLIVCLLSVNGYAYGPRGHKLVGAIADRRIQKNPAVAQKVRELLSGLTLARVATLPDEIKSWDACRNPPTQGPVINKRIRDELRAFHTANLCSSHPSHQEFHYTDIPVFGNEAYADGEIGRGQFDIVQMIPFCIRVLKGELPETNDRAITKSVALILLVHYLGDIHQPLHVGAEFFNSSGQPFEPTTANKGFEDQGGNKLTLFTFFNHKLTTAGQFHSYWDGQTVDNAFGAMQDSKVAQQLASQEPANWKLTGGTETWAVQLANDILPIAREAHQRLQYKDIKVEAGKRDIISGNAQEKKKPGGTFYAIWASQVVKKEIQKGGWRLAALLEEILK